MLWTLIDVLAFIVALGLVLALMPGTRARSWRSSLLERMRERERDQSNASPRRESSSTK